MSTVTAALAGAGIGLGVLLVAAGLVGVDTAPVRARRGVGRLGPGWVVRVAAGAVAAVVVAVVTGWVTAALMVAAGVVAAPALAGGRRRRAGQIETVEALAGWAESLRDSLSASAGIQEAVQASASPEVASPVIAGPLARLAARMQHGDPLAALTLFADEVADPVGDLIVAAVGMALTGRSGNLTAVLSEAATAARASATMRMKVEASRARVHTSVRITVGVTVVFGLGLMLFQRAYLDPFDTAVGQLMLIVVGAVFGLGFWGVARMSRQAPLPRLVAASGEPAQ